MRFPRLALWVALRLGKVAQRLPDFVIGDDYMHRWWVIPRNKVFNVYLHHIMHSDDDRALHDHPWWSVSLCLAGQMLEHTPKGVRRVCMGDVVFRGARSLHRLEIDKVSQGRGCWTLFITGPVIREWGFACPKGWVSWRDFKSRGGCGEYDDA